VQGIGETPILAIEPEKSSTGAGGLGHAGHELNQPLDIATGQGQILNVPGLYGRGEVRGRRLDQRRRRCHLDALADAAHLQLSVGSGCGARRHDDVGNILGRKP